MKKPIVDQLEELGNELYGTYPYLPQEDVNKIIKSLENIIKETKRKTGFNYGVDLLNFMLKEGYRSNMVRDIIEAYWMVAFRTREDFGKKSKLEELKQLVSFYKSGIVRELSEKYGDLYDKYGSILWVIYTVLGEIAWWEGSKKTAENVGRVYIDMAQEIRKVIKNYGNEYGGVFAEVVGVFLYWRMKDGWDMKESLNEFIKLMEDKTLGKKLMSRLYPYRIAKHFELIKDLGEEAIPRILLYDAFPERRTDTVKEIERLLDEADVLKREKILSFLSSFLLKNNSRQVIENVLKAYCGFARDPTITPDELDTISKMYNKGIIRDLGETYDASILLPIYIVLGELALRGERERGEREPIIAENVAYLFLEKETKNVIENYEENMRRHVIGMIGEFGYYAINYTPREVACEFIRLLENKPFGEYLLKGSFPIKHLVFPIHEMIRFENY